MKIFQTYRLLHENVTKHRNIDHDSKVACPVLNVDQFQPESHIRPLKISKNFKSAKVCNDLFSNQSLTSYEGIEAGQDKKERGHFPRHPNQAFLR